MILARSYSAIVSCTVIMIASEDGDPACKVKPLEPPKRFLDPE